MKLITAARTLVTAALTALAVTACSPRRFSVSASSMAPTIPPGSEVIGDMSAYSSRAPQRWDIVLFDPPPHAGGQLWVMRIVGLPGERVSFGATGGIVINGKPLTPPPQLKALQWQGSIPTSKVVPVPHPFDVPSDCYYVLGDNSVSANDSRFWGAVPRKNISGKVISK